MCVFCKLLKNPHDESTFIKKFDHTVAFLNFNQDSYKGQSILVLKEHYDHLHLVPVELQQKIIPELMQITEALLKAFSGFRINHQSLGNQVSHVHWHITPRYPGDINAGGPPQHSLSETRLADGEYRQISDEVRKFL